MRTAVLILAMFLLGGCQSYQAGKSAARVAESQHGGTATGSGATLTAPNNSAAPSVQVASERVRYFPPGPSPISPAPREQPLVISMPPAEGTAPAVEPVVPPAPPPYVPMVAEIERTTSTTLGEHQSAEGLMKVAAEATKLGFVRIIGIIGLVLGCGGFLYSHNNEKDGYPMVWVLVLIVGLVLIFTNNGWLLLGATVPGVLWAAQKFGVLRIPVQ